MLWTIASGLSGSDNGRLFVFPINSIHFMNRNWKMYYCKQCLLSILTSFCSLAGVVHFLQIVLWDLSTTDSVLEVNILLCFDASMWPCFLAAIKVYQLNFLLSIKISCTLLTAVQKCALVRNVYYQNWHRSVHLRVLSAFRRSFFAIYSTTDGLLDGKVLFCFLVYPHLAGFLAIKIIGLYCIQKLASLRLCVFAYITLQLIISTFDAGLEFHSKMLMGKTEVLKVQCK